MLLNFGTISIIAPISGDLEDEVEEIQEARDFMGSQEETMLGEDEYAELQKILMDKEQLRKQCQAVNLFSELLQNESCAHWISVLILHSDELQPSDGTFLCSQIQH